MLPNSKNVLLSASVCNELCRFVSLKYLSKARLSYEKKEKHQIELMLNLFHSFPRKNVMCNLDLLLKQEVPCTRTFEKKLQKAVASKSFRITQKQTELNLLFHCRNEIIELEKCIKRQNLGMLPVMLQVMFKIVEYRIL